jgi:hypothetical protein
MEKNCKQGTSLVVLFTNYYTDYETTENEMDADMWNVGERGECILNLGEDSSRKGAH